MANLIRLLILLAGLRPFAGTAQTSLRMADLGTCTTASGTDVLDCRLAYMRFGRPNDAGDNTVLIPSWYGGTPSSLVRLLGADAFVDTTRFHVILVGTFGDGISISPSNSARQPGDSFPRVTIADMIAAQHRLLTGHLGITRLHAVIGFSMGGMQALEWAVRHPQRASAIVSLHGTPQPSAHDTYTYRALRWMTRLSDGLLPEDSAGVPLADLWNVIRATPARINHTTARHAVAAQALERGALWNTLHPADNRLQLDAIIAHDVASRFGGDLAAAAAAVRARMLLVVAQDDRIVGPEASRTFASFTGARTLEVSSDCGHFALYCEPAIAARVRAFLAGAGPAAAEGPGPRQLSGVRDPRPANLLPAREPESEPRPRASRLRGHPR